MSKRVVMTALLAVALLLTIASGVAMAQPQIPANYTIWGQVHVVTDECDRGPMPYNPTTSPPEGGVIVELYRDTGSGWVKIRDNRIEEQEIPVTRFPQQIWVGESVGVDGSCPTCIPWPETKYCDDDDCYVIFGTTPNDCTVVYTGPAEADGTPISPIDPAEFESFCSGLDIQPGFDHPIPGEPLGICQCDNATGECECDWAPYAIGTDSENGEFLFQVSPVQGRYKLKIVDPSGQYAGALVVQREHCFTQIPGWGGPCVPERILRDLEPTDPEDWDLEWYYNPTIDFPTQGPIEFQVEDQLAPETCDQAASWVYVFGRVMTTGPGDADPQPDVRNGMGGLIVRLQRVAIDPFGYNIPFGAPWAFGRSWETTTVWDGTNAGDVAHDGIYGFGITAIPGWYRLWLPYHVTIPNQAWFTIADPDIGPASSWTPWDDPNTVYEYGPFDFLVVPLPEG